MSEEHPHSESIHDISRATLIAWVTYAGPAWWGFLTLGDGTDPICH